MTAIATLPPYFTTGQAFGDLSPNTVLPYIVAAAASALFGATIFAVLIRSFRQLRLVHHLHTQATNINLLKLAPAHAFSDLTARTGMGLVVLLFLGFLYNPTSFSGSYLVAAYVLIAVPAVVIFIAPVIGMRGRLAAEKLRALDDTSERLQATYERLESNIDEGEYRDLQGMETAVSALLRKRQLLQEISTWPWDPGTLRGFASTLLLPILLWLVTRLLGRLI